MSNYGIKTGCNEAFIIDEAKKNELIAADPKSAEIIRPFFLFVKGGNTNFLKNILSVTITQAAARSFSNKKERNLIIIVCVFGHIGDGNFEGTLPKEPFPHFLKVSTQLQR